MIGPKRSFSAYFFAIGLAALWVSVAGIAVAQDSSEFRHQLDEAHKQNRMLQAKLAETMAVTAKLQAELQSLQAQRDKNLTAVVQLTDQLNQAFSELKRLRELNARLSVLVPQGVGIEGVVTATPGTGLVQVSLGSDDGLKQGQLLTVYRVFDTTKTELGYVKVVEISPDNAICKNDPKLLKTPIKKGDRVTTGANLKATASGESAGLVPPTPDEPPELIDGRVLSVGEDEEVEISFGTDDGLRPGHRLEVYRLDDGQGIYIGRIEVVKTAAKKSVCKSILEFRKDTIRKGDRIVSKIY